MKHVASAASIAAACGLVVATNVAILAAAGWNRQGRPQATLLLTERELGMPAARQDEVSSLELKLRLTHDPPGVLQRAAMWKHRELPGVRYDWLDRDKLRELGLRVDLDAADPEADERYSRSLSRPVWVAVEQDGAAWRRWIAGREAEVTELRAAVERGEKEPSALAEAEALLALDRTMRSRLFPVDAGLDAQELRRRYPDGTRYAVLGALLRPEVVHPEDGEPYLTAKWTGALVGQVHVPRESRRRLESFLPEETWREVEKREREQARSGWPVPVAPRYRATLALGRRHEPWLVEVTTGLR